MNKSILIISTVYAQWKDSLLLFLSMSSVLSVYCEHFSVLYLFIMRIRSWRKLLLLNRRWIKKKGLIIFSNREILLYGTVFCSMIPWPNVDVKKSWISEEKRIKVQTTKRSEVRSAWGNISRQDDAGCVGSIRGQGCPRHSRHFPEFSGWV